MTSASLQLLKGGQKHLIEKELETPAAPAPTTETAAGEETVQYDPDKMNTAEIDALVKEHEIEVPDTWPKMTLAKKRAWLNEQFSADEDEAPVEDAPAPEEAAAADVAEEPKAEVAQVPATTTKKATTKKAAAKKAADAGEIVEADVIVDIVGEIEHLGRDDALKLVHQLTEETEVTFFRLGGALSIIMRNEWFKPDYPTFRDYVEQVYGMAYRRAAYWVAIYNALSESGIPWAQVKDVGWTKLKEIAQVLTPENVDEWVKRASSMNTQSLIAAVKAAQATGTPAALEDANATKSTVSKTFKLHTDQVATLEAAIDKAKHQTDTTVDTVALQYICEDFIGSLSMEERLKKLGLEKVIALVGKVFPDAELTLSLPE